MLDIRNDAGKTKAGICITTDKFEKLLPNKTQKIIVKSVLFEIAKLLKNISRLRYRLPRFIA